MATSTPQQPSVTLTLAQRDSTRDFIGCLIRAMWTLGITAGALATERKSSPRFGSCPPRFGR
jgi:hypothetical protein